MSYSSLPNQPFVPPNGTWAARNGVAYSEPERERFESMFADRIFSLPTASGAGPVVFADNTGREVVRDRHRKDTAQYAETKVSHNPYISRTMDAHALAHSSDVRRLGLMRNTRRDDREAL